MKVTTTILLAGMGAALFATAAPAAEKTMRFAVVPKAMNNPYFDLSRDGCMKRAKELGNVECVYRGPVEHEPASQVQIIQDLITQGVDGMAISVPAEARLVSSRPATGPISPPPPVSTRILRAPSCTRNVLNVNVGAGGRKRARRRENFVRHLFNINMGRGVAVFVKLEPGFDARNPAVRTELANHRFGGSGRNP